MKRTYEWSTTPYACEFLNGITKVKFMLPTTWTEVLLAIDPSRNAKDLVENLVDEILRMPMIISERSITSDSELGPYLAVLNLVVDNMVQLKKGASGYQHFW